MSLIQIKDGVNIWGLEPPMRKVLKLADEVWARNGRKCIVTSARDGLHSWGSLHYYGLAVDLRMRFFTDREKIKVTNQMSMMLDPEYDVVNEGTHLHIEYDPKI